VRSTTADGTAPPPPTRPEADPPSNPVVRTSNRKVSERGGVAVGITAIQPAQVFPEPLRVARGGAWVPSDAFVAGPRAGQGVDARRYGGETVFFWTCAGWSCAALPPTPTSSPHSETTRARSFSATPNFPLLRFAYPAADGEMGVDEELTLLLGGRLRVRLTAAFSLGRRLPRREVWAMVRLSSWRSSSMILHCRGEAAARLRPT
jgi:hypothetical protein